MLDENIYKEHYETIVHMTRNLGTDTTDDYLRQELSSASKEVAVLREKILLIKGSHQKLTNMDEVRHLQYDIEDAQVLLDNLLHKLKVTDERYLCFKEYLRRHPKNIE
jgi:hypothetical protein